MSIPAAYLGVIIIWSTTPLTVKWSGEDVGFLFGVTGRMVLGTILSLIVLKAIRIPLPMNRQAHATYSASAIGIFGAMLCVYWSAQFIPSGFISVIFAIAPITTGILASVILRERDFNFLKILGFLFGFTGMALIFHDGMTIGENALQGIAGTFAAVLMFSISGVLVKKYGQDMHALAANSGGLIYGTTLFLLTWVLVDGSLPETVPTRAMGSILYLGIVGTAVGFTLYMYLLGKQSPSTLAMITLVTPVTALYLGSWLNGEMIGKMIWAGTGMILVGLMLYTEPKQLMRRLKA